MAKVKRYFWLKLRKDFFNQKEIKLLRKIAGGDTYTIIYLKILLLSLENDGKVYFDGVATSFAEEIALEIDEDAENVGVCMKFLEQKGLLVYESEDEMDLTALPEMIGSESESARRMRKHRQNKVLQEKTSQCDTLPSQCDKNVTTEIEKEKEIDKELEIEKDQEQENRRGPSPSKDQILSDLYLTYQQIYGVMNGIVAQSIKYWSEDIDPALVKYAMEITAKSINPPRFAYTEGIMKKWVARNITTLEQVKALEQEHFNQQASKQSRSYGCQTRQEVVPEYIQHPPEEVSNPEGVAAAEKALDALLGGNT